jgi:tRNA threonylcarbamoyladenosine modification (KEOPS) complex  Pcc1 subunit
MNYAVTIEIKKDPETIQKLFLTEVSERQRSKFTISKKKNSILFEVKAKDATALKSTLNNITELLTVYEKLKGLKG